MKLPFLLNNGSPFGQRASAFNGHTEGINEVLRILVRSVPIVRNNKQSVPRQLPQQPPGSVSVPSTAPVAAVCASAGMPSDKTPRTKVLQRENEQRAS
jgi:hypothetical protein